MIIVLASLILGCNGRVPESASSTYLNSESELDMPLNPLDSLALVLENLTLNRNSKAIRISDYDTVNLYELDLGYKQILYISEIQCSSCIDQELELAKRYYGLTDLVLLCNYGSLRDLKLYLHLRQVEFSAFMVDNEMSGLFARLTNPTYFKLNNGFKPSSVFFASISTPKRSESYHQIMSGFTF